MITQPEYLSLNPDSSTDQVQDFMHVIQPQLPQLPYLENRDFKKYPPHRIALRVREVTKLYFFRCSVLEVIIHYYHHLSLQYLATYVLAGEWQ